MQPKNLSSVLNQTKQLNLTDVGNAYTALPTSHAFGSEAFAAACRQADKRSLAYRAIKRAFDIAFSLASLIVGLVPCLLLSLIISIDTQSTPLYRQERIGRCGKPFRIVKFRTMVADSDNLERYLSDAGLAAWKGEGKVENDPRITRFGAFLRKTSIDEFPQFVNVLLGQLSVVGPRAVTELELKNYGPEVVRLLSVPQGVTGRWQCGPRNDALFSDGSRQAIELSYVDDASLRVDARIITKTIRVMLLEKSGK